MTLPPLSIPDAILSVEIPQMIHPLFVHFAIALPVFVLMLEIINLIVQKRIIGIISFFFMVLISGVFLATYITGTTDGVAAKQFLSFEAKDLLIEHKYLGVYLVYASGILMLFKLLSILLRKPITKGLFFIVLIAFIVAVLNEGKKGGALVYKYGVNVKSTSIIVRDKQYLEAKHNKNIEIEKNTTDVKPKDKSSYVDLNASVLLPKISTADESEDNLSYVETNRSVK